MLGFQLSATMASLTRDRVNGITLLTPLTTRDTVPTETPASLATSRTVGRLALLFEERVTDIREFSIENESIHIVAYIGVRSKDWFLIFKYQKIKSCSIACPITFVTLCIRRKR